MSRLTITTYKIVDDVWVGQEMEATIVAHAIPIDKRYYPEIGWAYKLKDGRDNVFYVNINEFRKAFTLMEGNRRNHNGTNSENNSNI